MGENYWCAVSLIDCRGWKGDVRFSSSVTFKSVCRTFPFPYEWHAHPCKVNQRNVNIFSTTKARRFSDTTFAGISPFFVVLCLLLTMILLIEDKKCSSPQYTLMLRRHLTRVSLWRRCALTGRAPYVQLKNLTPHTLHTTHDRKDDEYNWLMPCYSSVCAEPPTLPPPCRVAHWAALPGLVPRRRRRSARRPCLPPPYKIRCRPRPQSAPCLPISAGSSAGLQVTGRWSAQCCMWHVPICAGSPVSSDRPQKWT